MQSEDAACLCPKLGILDDDWASCKMVAADAMTSFGLVMCGEIQVRYARPCEYRLKYTHTNLHANDLADQMHMHYNMVAQ
jgi:uncharacterized protein YlaI